MSAPVIAYQLSLLGDEPKPCRAWRRAYFVLTICGERYMSDEEKRQHIMLRPDSLAPVAGPLVGSGQTQRGER